MKKLFTSVAFLFVSMVAVAQQDPQYTQNMFTKLAINPGYAGASDAICSSLLFRNQWTGFDGAPKTFLFTADMPIKAINSGVGLVANSDQLGYDKNLNFRLSYAYRGIQKFGFGFDVGYMQKSIDGDHWIYNQGNDPSIPPSVSGGTVDFSFGGYYDDRTLYVGASATHLSEGQIKYSANGQNIAIKLARHYYLMGGYRFELTEDLKLMPMILVKSDAASMQLDVNCNVLYQNRYWGGLSYRLQDAIAIMAGIEIMPNLKLGYSYDLTTSDIKSYSSGTHEIMLGYCFKIVIPPKHEFHRNTRNL